MVTVRRLGAGDEAILAGLARDDAAFAAGEEGRTIDPLAPTDAVRYLRDPAVLHLVAEDEGTVVGHVFCHVQRRRHSEPHQVMLYEIGVHRARRGEGIGATLVDAVEQWMRHNGVRVLWVSSDAGAAGFYRRLGFRSDDDQPVQLTKVVDPPH